MIIIGRARGPFLLHLILTSGAGFPRSLQPQKWWASARRPCDATRRNGRSRTGGTATHVRGGAPDHRARPMGTGRDSPTRSALDVDTHEHTGSQLRHSVTSQLPAMHYCLRIFGPRIQVCEAASGIRADLAEGTPRQDVGIFASARVHVSRHPRPIPLLRHCLGVGAPAPAGDTG